MLFKVETKIVTPYSFYDSVYRYWINSKRSHFNKNVSTYSKPDKKPISQIPSKVSPNCHIIVVSV